MDETILGLTAQVLTGYLNKNRLTDAQLPDLIRTVYQGLSSAGVAAALAADRVQPAVDVKKSVFPNRLICLVCGQPFRMLKRHLVSEHQLTPAAYRERFDLPQSYPIVAPEYAKVRSALAKQIGLGRKPAAKPVRRMTGRKRR